MKVFEVLLTETKQRLVEIEAETLELALSKAEDDYADGKIVLTDDDLRDYTVEKHREY